MYCGIILQRRYTTKIFIGNLLRVFHSAEFDKNDSQTRMWPSSNIHSCTASARYVSLSHSLSMALQPFVGPWPLFSFLILYTVGRTPWTADQPVARPPPIHRINTHRHTRLKWDSNPRPECSSGRTLFMP
jgi:hypothetical protein